MPPHVCVKYDRYICHEGERPTDAPTLLLETTCIICRTCPLKNLSPLTAYKLSVEISRLTERERCALFTSSIYHNIEPEKLVFLAEMIESPDAMVMTQLIRSIYFMDYIPRFCSMIPSLPPHFRDYLASQFIAHAIIYAPFRDASAIVRAFREATGKPVSIASRFRYLHDLVSALDIPTIQNYRRAGMDIDSLPIDHVWFIRNSHTMSIISSENMLSLLASSAFTSLAPPGLVIDMNHEITLRRILARPLPSEEA